MDHQGYNRLINEDNRASSDEFLTVNCVGYASMSEQFETFKPAGRLDFYLQYMCEGTLLLRFGGNSECEFVPGQFIIHHPGTPYRYSMVDGCEHIGYYWLHFTGCGAEKLLSDSGISCGQIYSVGDIEQIKSSFKRLFSEFLLRDGCFDYMCSGYLIKICCLLGRAVRAQVRQNPTSERIVTSLRYIHSHFSQDISVPELAEMEHLTENYYRSLFIRCTGSTPVKYIRLIRLARARELLAETALSVGEIAENVGYEDASYFSRVFRHHTGMTPERYRSENNGR